MIEENCHSSTSRPLKPGSIYRDPNASHSMAAFLVLSSANIANTNLALITYGEISYLRSITSSSWNIGKAHIVSPRCVREYEEYRILSGACYSGSFQSHLECIATGIKFDFSWLHDALLLLGSSGTHMEMAVALSLLQDVAAQKETVDYYLRHCLPGVREKYDAVRNIATFTPTVPTSRAKPKPSLDKHSDGVYDEDNPMDHTYKPPSPYRTKAEAAAEDFRRNEKRKLKSEWSDGHAAGLASRPSDQSRFDAAAVDELNGWPRADGMARERPQSNVWPTPAASSSAIVTSVIAAKKQQQKQTEQKPVPPPATTNNNKKKEEEGTKTMSSASTSTSTSTTGTSRKSSKKDQIINSVKMGAQVALADEAGNVILQFADSASNGRLAPYMQTEEGRSLVKMVAATLLLHAIDFASEDEDTRGKVAAGCGLVIEAASRDFLQPRMAELRKVALDLARIGGKTNELTSSNS